MLLCNDVSITISNDHVALYFCLSKDGVDYRQCQVLLYRNSIRYCIRYVMINSKLYEITCETAFDVQYYDTAVYLTRYLVRYWA